MLKGDASLHFLPLAGVVLIVLVACGWRPWLQHRRHGTCRPASLLGGTLIGIRVQVHVN